ncbi:MAG: hypothetical protein N2C14_06730 [Planctomycetales bacterium]
MGIPVVCSSCGKSFSVKDKYAGKLGSCPFCNRVVRVPDMDAVANAEEVEFVIQDNLSDTPPSSASLANPVIKVTCSSCQRVNLGGLKQCAYCGQVLP